MVMIYSYLKYEFGVIVLRIPKTETQGRVHTSAQQAVLPEQGVDIEIKDLTAN